MFNSMSYMTYTVRIDEVIIIVLVVVVSVMVKLVPVMLSISDNS